MMRQSGPNRRLSLLQAALDLFSTQGYAGTTTKAIAERSGVSEAMLFRHFPTKEDVLRAIVEELSPRPLFPPPPSLRDMPVREALETFFTRYFDAFWANLAFMSMLFTTPKSEQSVFEDQWNEFRQQGFFLYTLLDERAKRRELKLGIAPVATDVIVAAMTGYSIRLVDEPPEDWEAARDAYVANLLRILFGGLLPEKNSARRVEL